MATQLEPTGQTARTRRTYPWDEWLNGRPWHLVPADDRGPGDFDAEPRNFVSYLYAQARKRGLKLAVCIEPNDSIVMQAYDPTTHPRPLLPSPFRRLANGDVDKTAPIARPTKGAPKEVCVLCGEGINANAAALGNVCRSFVDPTWTCQDGTPKPRPKLPRR